MTMTDAERTTAIEEIKQAHTDLTGVLDDLNEGDMLRPNTVGHWNGKDVLAHLAAWNIEAARHINARDLGEEDSMPGEPEFDDWNEEQVSKSRNMTVDQVRAYFDAAHNEFTGLVRTSATMTPRLATGMTAGHYAEHIDQFRAMKAATT